MTVAERSSLRPDVADLLVVLGGLLMIGAVALVHGPAALFLAGVLIVALAVFLSRPRR
jgi:hypothetical protein